MLSKSLNDLQLDQEEADLDVARRLQEQFERERQDALTQQVRYLYARNWKMNVLRGRGSTIHEAGTYVWERRGKIDAGFRWLNACALPQSPCSGVGTLAQPQPQVL